MMQSDQWSTRILAVAVVGMILWGLVGPTVRQTLQQEAQDAVGTIDVSGSSALRVQPDRVVVIFRVEIFAETPQASQEENARVSRRVLAAIRGHDVEEEEIATADFSLRPEYEAFRPYREIVGYWSANTIAVTLRDVAKLEGVLVDALSAGATAVEGIEFSVSNLRELRDQARELAVQAALEKATDMAAAAGMDIGRVASIAEDGFHSGYYGYRGDRQWTNYQNVVQELVSEGAIVLEDGSISLGQIVVSAQVGLRAELVPPQ